MTTDNKVLVEKYRLLPAIDCVASKPKKMIPTENDFVKGEKSGFSDRIGGITNIGTSQLNLQASYRPEDPEYKELEYRVSCCMLFQQAAIDLIKTGVFREPPKHWNSFGPNKIEDDDDEETIAKKEFNRKLVTKKPYFFIYNYDYVNSEYKKYINSANSNAKLRFGKDVESLINSLDLTDDEKIFLDNYHKYLPVDCSPGVINRICWQIEKEFPTLDVLPNATFDYHILTSDAIYEMSDFHLIEEMYGNYIKTVRDIKKRYARRDDNLADADMVEDIDLAKEEFKAQCLSICNNEKMLTNILIELCYNSNGSKFMVWDLFGEQIIENLLCKYGKFTFPVRSETGDIIFDGENFELKEVVI